tara:strand:+ start:342 stop:1358 length:1017 start_codon:yes stop_codon:yes gene_type:complete
MNRCLDLALNGIGKVSPNPLVGSVLVYDNQIIGEGFHEKYGLSHAETNAIKNVKDKSLISKAILYVNLEPCSHHGNTPPCCEMIVSNNIRHVVIGCLDNSTKVNGKGIDYLKSKGVKVTLGVLEEQCKNINRRFFVNHQLNRPYIILKWAQSKDGFIDKKRVNNQKGINWITQKETKKIVHQWRAQEDAILVGRKTVTNDNPELTVRESKGMNPLRVVMDPNLKLNLDSNVFNMQSKTIIVNQIKNQSSNHLTYLKIKENNNLNDLFKYLQKHKIGSIIVEGGAKTINYFIQKNIWDEARVITGDVNFNDGLKAPKINGKYKSLKRINKDIIHTYLND